jgi:uncharacterized oligopeptide transporter (OPT) family protein
MKKWIWILILTVVLAGCFRPAQNMLNRFFGPKEIEEMTVAERTETMITLSEMETRLRNAASMNKLVFVFIIAGVVGGFAVWRGSNIGWGIIAAAVFGYLWVRADQKLMTDSKTMIWPAACIVAGVIAFGFRDRIGKLWARQIAKNENPTRMTKGLDAKYKNGK